MAALLTGLLGSLGGGGNLVKSVGNLVSETTKGLKEGKGFGKSLLGGVTKGVQSLAGLENINPSTNETLNNQVTNAKAVIVPKQTTPLARSPYQMGGMSYQNTSMAGFPAQRGYRRPLEYEKYFNKTSGNYNKRSDRRSRSPEPMRKRRNKNRDLERKYKNYIE